MSSLNQEVEAYCVKCQLVLPHHVTRLAGARISRVACKTCKDDHGYRKNPPKAGGAATNAQKLASANRKMSQAAANFDALMQEVDPAHATPYSSGSRFAANDVIDHKVFGLGKVTRILTGNKMEVMFRANSKILIHAG